MNVGTAGMSAFEAGLNAGIISGMASGAINGGLSAAINGGSIGDIYAGTILGIAAGGAGGALLGGISGALNKFGNTLLPFDARGFNHKYQRYHWYIKDWLYSVTKGASNNIGNFLSTVGPSMTGVATGTFSSYNGMMNAANGGGRPDADGHLTWFEARSWYKNGQGLPLYVNLGNLSLDYLFAKAFLSRTQTFNLVHYSSDIHDFLVHGQLEFTLSKDEVGFYVEVLSGKTEYNFEPHELTYSGAKQRNRRTKFAKLLHGKGQSYNIEYYGRKYIPINKPSSLKYHPY